MSEIPIKIHLIKYKNENFFIRFPENINIKDSSDDSSSKTIMLSKSQPDNLSLSYLATEKPCFQPIIPASENILDSEEDIHVIIRKKDNKYEIEFLDETNKMDIAQYPFRLENSFNIEKKGDGYEIKLTNCGSSLELQKSILSEKTQKQNITGEELKKAIQKMGEESQSRTKKYEEQKEKELEEKEKELEEKQKELSRKRVEAIGKLENEAAIKAEEERQKKMEQRQKKQKEKEEQQLKAEEEKQLKEKEEEEKKRYKSKFYKKEFTKRLNNIGGKYKTRKHKKNT